MECNRKIQKLSIVENDGMSLIEKLPKFLNEFYLEMAVTSARRIWLRRNCVIYGGDFMSPKTLHISALESMEAFNHV